jgi:hypothetical protein
VGMEDLFMLQVMYNQATARRGASGTPAYVASTISASTYNNYDPVGRGSLSSALTSAIGSNACDHLVSTEATYSEFWGGSHNFSSVNKWGAVNVYGPAQSGQIQFAGTVFWYAAGTVARPPHRNQPIHLP